MGTVPGPTRDPLTTLELPAPTGLSSVEAAERLRRGEGNRAVSASSRTYGRILRTNVFNLYNSILFVIGAALLALGRYGDAVISVSIGLLNAVISAVQEIRAKRQLDRLQVLGRSTVVVLRDGGDVDVLPEEVVRGDVLRVRPGDQLVVDGPVLDGAVEVDESLLTGESEAQARTVGQDLLSGSQVVGGAGLQLARDVGAASYASRLTAEARSTTTDTTPLQHQIAFCVRMVMVVVVLMSGAILLQAALEGFTLVRVVQTAAVLSGLVPYGLFFLIVLAYTAGAVYSSRHGALVQRVNAVESVSNVDVVCTDKTGTLTTGRLTVAEVVPLGGHDAREVEQALGSMARSTEAGNLTTTALAAQLPGTEVPVVEMVPFSSTLRWSAVRTGDVTWVLGAAEALAPVLDAPGLSAEVAARTAQGLRVLVFARATDPEAGAARRRRGDGAAPVRGAGRGRPGRRAPAGRPRHGRPAAGGGHRPQGPLRRRPRHRRGARRPRGARRRPPGARRGPGRALGGRAGRGGGGQRRVRAGRAGAEGARRHLPAPSGPLRGHGRRRAQRRPGARRPPRSASPCAAAARRPATSPTSSSPTTRWPRCCPPAGRGAASSPASRSPRRCSSPGWRRRR